MFDELNETKVIKGGKKSNEGTINQRLLPRKGFKGREELKGGEISGGIIIKEIHKVVVFAFWI